MLCCVALHLCLFLVKFPFSTVVLRCVVLGPLGYFSDIFLLHCCVVLCCVVLCCVVLCCVVLCCVVLCCVVLCCVVLHLGLFLVKFPCSTVVLHCVAPVPLVR